MTRHIDAKASEDKSMTDDEVLRVLDDIANDLKYSDPHGRSERFNAAVTALLADGQAWKDRGDALQAERDALRAEQEHNNALIQRQSDLLTGAVNVLRGDPPSDTLWSHHDVAELARDMKGRAERAESALEVLRGQVAELMKFREGGLPTKGWLRDNDQSRRVLHELNELLAMKNSGEF